MGETIGYYGFFYSSVFGWLDILFVPLLVPLGIYHIIEIPGNDFTNVPTGVCTSVLPLTPKSR